MIEVVALVGIFFIWRRFNLAYKRLQAAIDLGNLIIVKNQGLIRFDLPEDAPEEWKEKLNHEIRFYTSGRANPLFRFFIKELTPK